MLLFLCGAVLQQASMYEKIVPNPTGANGYEEYLRAADIAALPEFSNYDRWLSNPRGGNSSVEIDKPVDVDPKDPDLTVRRKWADRFRACCDLISNGNRKAVADPRGIIKVDTLFPEMARFRALARFEAVSAHVSFADGQTGQGIRHIEDAVIFGNKISGSILIGRLVGIACDAISFVELDDHWAQLSVSDAEELQRFFGSQLSEPSRLVESIRAERRATHTAIDQLFANPDEFASLMYDDDKEKALAGSLSKLSANDAQGAQSATNAAIDAYYDSILTILNGPEAGWFSLKDLGDAENSDDPKLPLATRLANLVMPTMSAVLVAESRDRTRMRLAYLTAKAVDFRWIMGRLPDRIEDFTTPSERTDPTSGRAFRYRRDGPWFRITREAKDALGGVSLFKSPAPFDPNTGPLRP